jgi:hypothetical protein
MLKCLQSKIIGQRRGRFLIGLALKANIWHYIKEIWSSKAYKNVFFCYQAVKSLSKSLMLPSSLQSKPNIQNGCHTNIMAAK